MFQSAQLQDEYKCFMIMLFNVNPITSVVAIEAPKVTMRFVSAFGLIIFM